MWIAVDKNKTIMLFHEKPERFRDEWICSETDLHDAYEMPNFNIKNAIGRNLTWDDEPFDLETLKKE